MDVSFLYGFLFCGILLMALLVLYFSYKTIKREIRPVPSHVQLYFDEHFKDIVREWDIINRTEVKTWCNDITKRLGAIGKDVEKVKDFRKRFSPRLDKLDMTVRGMERV